MSEEEIDLSDIPEVRDWSKAVRGKFYRPRKAKDVSLKEEIHEAGSKYDGKITGGSLVEIMNVVDVAMGRAIRALDEQVKELEQSLELIREADMRAIKMWQEAHPKWNLVWPDRGRMIFWLLEQLEAKK